MTVVDSIAARQIDEVVHFTSSHGCLGTLYTKQLQSRQRLEGDPMVEYLFKPNAKLRRYRVSGLRQSLDFPYQYAVLQY